MKEGLLFNSIEGVSYITDPYLSKSGILHGFFEAEFDSLTRVTSDPSDVIGRLFNLSSVYSLKQTHSDIVIDLGVSESLHSFKNGITEGDGFILPRSSIIAPVGALIRTADCMPVIALTDRTVALIHAGWRGVAKRVVERTLTGLRDRGERVLSVTIGPCAGPNTYEVGKEVLHEIGEGCVYLDSTNKDKYLLNLSATLQKSLELIFGDTVRIRSSDICTITDQRFHSFRRDGSSAGRNFSFIGVRS